MDLDAASDRNAARRDRSSASGDRTHASSDRLAAQTDRQLSSQERVATLIDELTGCYRREAGFHELEREIIKAERTEQLFTMAFIDIDGLKTVNDTHGHEVGDVLLRAVASSLRGVLRDYDIVVRYGGDEFVCGMSDVHADEVAGRLEQANTTLRDRDHATVSFGVVERLRGEGLASLISRADADMYEAKISRRGKIRGTLNAEPSRRSLRRRTLHAQLTSLTVAQQGAPRRSSVKRLLAMRIQDPLPMSQEIGHKRTDPDDNRQDDIRDEPPRADPELAGLDTHPHEYGQSEEYDVEHQEE
ncbi:MAG: GGDEF domain-containing protein [Aeromicrobium sp.]